MNNPSTDKTLVRAVMEMLTVANEYCHFMEHTEEKSLPDLLEFAHRILPLLYLKGSLLPELEVAHPEANERFITEENWQDIFTALREKFGEKDEYWLIDPLYINETEPLKASISEHLTDIYQDMKDYILLFQKNTFPARENAIAELKKLFGSHWGYKIGNISTRIHHLIYEGEEETPTDTSALNFF